MRYYKADLIREVEIDIDELGNPIYEYEYVPIGGVRLTEWTSRDINVYGRELTTGSRKVLVKPTAIEGFNYIRVQGKTYKILERKDLGRWLLLIVRGYRL